MNRRSFMSMLLASPAIAWAMPSLKTKAQLAAAITNTDEAYRLAENHINTRWRRGPVGAPGCEVCGAHATSMVRDVLSLPDGVIFKWIPLEPHWFCTGHVRESVTYTA